MKVLIIALPRTGSTSLLRKIAEDRNLIEIFEPFVPNSRFLYTSDMKNIVVKTIIRQHPDNLRLAGEFDEIILLSRKDFKQHAESLSFFYENKNKGYQSNDSYIYKNPSPKKLLIAQKRILAMNSELNFLSKRLKVPITYYEDIFDPNGPDRLRINVGITKKLL